MFKHSTPRPSGTVHITCEDGTEIIRDTLRCVHCQHTWIVQPGSGRRRGWCGSCGGPTCGSEDCGVCDHWEKKLEREETAAAAVESAGRAVIVTALPKIIVP